MHSRGEPSRRWLEYALRAIALGALVCSMAVIWQILTTPQVASTSGDAIRAAFERWSSRESPGKAHVLFAAMPPADVRDWAAALRAAGTELTWQSGELPATGISVEPVPDPRNPSRIWVAAPAGSKLVIRDDLGALDTVDVTHNGGAVINVARVEGTVRAAVGGSEATVAVRDKLDIKPVLLLAAAGWEGKFVMASLEEYGWKVDARLVISSKETVVQGPRAPQIDTDHYAAVIVLDSTASSHASDIDRYVRSGGGLIAAGDGAKLPALNALYGGSMGPLVEGRALDENERPAPTPRSALAVAPLKIVSNDAVVLERTPDGAIAALARRVGNGRVLQVGYYDTWRWRMAGVDEEPAQRYRAWWAAMVSSVAYAKRTSVPVSGYVDPTPLATLVSVLGPPERELPEGADWLTPGLLRWLFGIALVGLLGEWASRRLRGAH